MRAVDHECDCSPGLRTRSVSLYNIDLVTIVSSLVVSTLMLLLVRPLRTNKPGVWMVVFASQIIAIGLTNGPIYRGAALYLTVHAAALAIAVVLEARYPRTRYDDAAAGEWLLNGGYLILKRIGGPVIVLMIVATGLQHVPWGLSAHGVPVWAQSLVALVAVDLKRYWFHRWKHHFRWWWPFHRVHHLNENLCAIEHARMHLVEYVIAQAGASSLLLAALGIEPLAVLYGFALPAGLIAGVLSHANLDFPRGPLPWWAYVISTPNVHAVHHDKDGMNHNFGEVFVIWDVLFGTWKSPVAIGREFDFGVHGMRAADGVIREQLLFTTKA
jgi:sterol desaturase/sphingolipid hydroxylase (fatty acid hydroxylase superfamily)